MDLEKQIELWYKLYRENKQQDKNTPSDWYL